MNGTRWAIRPATRRRQAKAGRVGDNYVHFAAFAGAFVQGVGALPRFGFDAALRGRPGSGPVTPCIFVESAVFPFPKNRDSVPKQE
jgi:hypothetical protein